MSQVQELRDAFLKEVESKGDLSVHPADISRVKTDDNWVERFLLHHDNDHKMALEMMVDTMNWRREFKVNEINEQNIRMDYILEGGFFTRCRDKDGAALFIFKCKKHVKGSRDMEDLKRCVVYWFERLERQEKGKPITIFFDMEGCGLSNMDMEFTKYLIGLFKQYYPYFLNYIIIYEMAWILNAAFKVIKSWLPEKAVQKIKMLKKGDVGTYIPMNQALKCWGGDDDYVFEFVPETTSAPTQTNVDDANNVAMSNKKVHFAVDSPTSENADKDTTPAITDGGVLSVSPSSVITFVKHADEYVSTLELQNTDASINVSYKMKTTAPEKFRVRPSAGVLAPGDQATITVTLLPAYQIGGLTKDKFLVMSIPVDNVYMSQQDIAELWRNTSGKNVSQHRLRCAPVVNDMPRNGNVAGAGHAASGGPAESTQLLKLSASVAKLQECQQTMHQAVRNTQILQFITMSLVIVIGAALFFAVRYVLGDGSSGSLGGRTCSRDDL